MVWPVRRQVVRRQVFRMQSGHRPSLLVGRAHMILHAQTFVMAIEPQRLGRLAELFRRFSDGSYAHAPCAALQ